MLKVGWERLRLNELLNTLIELLEMGFEKLELLKMGLDQKAMMLSYPACECFV